MGTVNPSAYEKRRVPVDIQETNGVEVDALEDLKRQYQLQVVQEKPQTMTDLRQECKRRGIKMARTDNMQTLRAKLGKDAA